MLAGRSVDARRGRRDHDRYRIVLGTVNPGIKVNSLASLRMPSVPESSVRKLIARKPPVRVGRNSMGLPRSVVRTRWWRPWNVTQPPASTGRW